MDDRRAQIEGCMRERAVAIDSASVTDSVTHTHERSEGAVEHLWYR